MRGSLYKHWHKQFTIESWIVTHAIAFAAGLAFGVWIMSLIFGWPR